MDSQSALEKIRATFGQQSSEAKAEQTALDLASRTWEYLIKARRKLEYEWWINTQFVEGEQYVTFNGTSGRVTMTPAKDSDKVVINKIRQNRNFVVNALTSDHPQSHVIPGNPEDESYDKAKKTDYWINGLYDRQGINGKTKLAMGDAYDTKLGWFKITWDQDAVVPTSPYGGDKSQLGKGDVSIDRTDPWEIYFDPMMTGADVDTSRYIGHAISRTIGEIKANPHYKNKGKLSSDGKLAQSFIRDAQMRLQTVGAAQPQTASKDDGSTVILRELYIRSYKPAADDSNQSVSYIRKLVTTDNGVLLQDIEWPLSFYPFEMYLTDGDSPMRGGSPVRHLRSPQRAYNQINSIIHENARIMGKINWRIPRGSNVNVIDDSVGQFLEYDPSPGGAPEQVQPSGLPAYMPQHRDHLAQVIDDLGGNHSASYGKSPGSKASGELVNRLQEGDSNNFALMRDNLDDFMSRTFKKALRTFKECGATDQYVRSSSTNALGRYDYHAVKPSEVVTDGDVEVITGNRMPFSESDKQEFFLNMKKEGIITAQQFAKLLNSPDLDNALNTGQLDMERAFDENRRLLKGEVLEEPAKGEDHNVHMEVHVQLIKSPDYLKATDKVKSNIQDHYAAHINASYQLAQIAASLNVEAIKRSENIMVRQDVGQFTPNERTQFMSKVGVQSDAALIQARGGLTIQDPEQAELQAQWEDTQMMDGKPMLVSFGDNHQVHIETHSQLQQTAAWESIPLPIQNLINKHISSHEQALQAVQSVPGLIPQPGFDVPQQAQTQVAQPAGTPPPPPDLPPKPPQPQGQPGMPVAKAALNPQDPTPRPLMTHEMLQPKGAVKNQMATEKMAVRQEQEAQKAKEASKKLTQPKPKKKGGSK